MIVCINDCESILPELQPISCWKGNKYYKDIVYRNILVNRGVYNLYSMDNIVKYCGCVTSEFIENNFIDEGIYLDILDDINILFNKKMSL